MERLFGPSSNPLKTRSKNPIHPGSTQTRHVLNLHLPKPEFSPRIFIDDFPSYKPSKGLITESMDWLKGKSKPEKEIHPIKIMLLSADFCPNKTNHHWLDALTKKRLHMCSQQTKTALLGDWHAGLSQLLLDSHVWGHHRVTPTHTIPSYWLFSSLIRSPHHRPGTIDSPMNTYWNMLFSN